MSIQASIVTVATAAPVNEVQTLTIDATGGTFTLAFGGDPTTDIAYDADSATIELALEALDEFEEGEITVAGDGPHTMTFSGQYAGTDVALITSDPASLTGGAGTAVIVETTPGSARTAPFVLSDQSTRCQVHVRNTGSAVAYIGGEDVTASTGYPVTNATAHPHTITVQPNDRLCAVVADAASTTLAVLETPA